MGKEKRDLRIVFMGTPEFAVPSLAILIEHGYQVEEPDHWLRDGHPWELERPEFTQRVQFGGEEFQLRFQFTAVPGEPRQFFDRAPVVAGLFFQFGTRPGVKLARQKGRPRSCAPGQRGQRRFPGPRPA